MACCSSCTILKLSMCDLGDLGDEAEDIISIVSVEFSDLFVKLILEVSSVYAYSS